jgi:hypothetical protein
MALSLPFWLSEQHGGEPNPVFRRQPEQGGGESFGRQFPGNCTALCIAWEQALL